MVRSAETPVGVPRDAEDRRGMAEIARDIEELGLRRKVESPWPGRELRVR
jgi:hypothetical protein